MSRALPENRQLIQEQLRQGKILPEQSQSLPRQTAIRIAREFFEIGDQETERLRLDRYEFGWRATLASAGEEWYPGANATAIIGDDGKIKYEYPGF